jgi:hypothetical protein
MRLSRNLGMHGRSMRLWRGGIAVVLTTLLGYAVIAQAPAAQESAYSPPRAALLPAAPEAIYSSDPSDPWNRIFYYLFSRRIGTRLDYEFPEGAPFVDSVSTRTFERDEIGDRAIDPLYPSHFVITGSRLVLTEPAYTDFRQALHEALDEKSARSIIARALMQSDLWGAHDTLFFPFQPADEKELGQHRLEALELISRLIRKVALTREEIKTLSDNYSTATQNHAFPDVFGRDSGWVEVVWFHPRAHDMFAGFRRTARVFLKPTQPQHNVQKFLDGLPERNESDPIAGLDGVALITQLLLIDSRGRLRPTALTSEAQVRLFGKTNAGRLKRTSLEVCEISRKLFVREPRSGGLVAEAESTPVYGGGYGFAEGEQTGPDAPVVSPPVQVTLRARCAFCHGDDLTRLNTFSIARPPQAPHPPVKQLNRAAHETANFDITQKTKDKSFEGLHEYFDGRTSATARH